MANYLGMDVLGITCITDMAIGEELEPLTHEQVIEVAELGPVGPHSFTW